MDSKDYCFTWADLTLEPAPCLLIQPETYLRNIIEPEQNWLDPCLRGTYSNLSWNYHINELPTTIRPTFATPPAIKKKRENPSAVTVTPKPKGKRGKVTALKIKKIEELRSKYKWTFKRIGG